MNSLIIDWSFIYLIHWLTLGRPKVRLFSPLFQTTFKIKMFAILRCMTRATSSSVGGRFVDWQKQSRRYKANQSSWAKNQGVSCQPWLLELPCDNSGITRTPAEICWISIQIARDLSQCHKIEGWAPTREERKHTRQNERERKKDREKERKRKRARENGTERTRSRERERERERERKREQEKEGGWMRASEGERLRDCERDREREWEKERETEREVDSKAHALFRANTHTLCPSISFSFSLFISVKYPFGHVHARACALSLSLFPSFSLSLSSFFSLPTPPRWNHPHFGVGVVGITQKKVWAAGSPLSERWNKVRGLWGITQKKVWAYGQLLKRQWNRVWAFCPHWVDSEIKMKYIFHFLPVSARFFDCENRSARCLTLFFRDQLVWYCSIHRTLILYTVLPHLRNWHIRGACPSSYLFLCCWGRCPS